MNAYIENNLIDPIDQSIPYNQKNDILDKLWELTRRKGKLYGVPFCISTTVFFYNEDLFSSVRVDPPSTWEEMIKAGKKLTVDTDGDGIPDQYAIMFWIDGFYGIAPFLWAHGGEFFSEDGTRILLTSDEMVQTIIMLRDLVFTHEIMPRNWTDWEGAQGFLTGRLAMGPFTSAAISYGEQNLPWTLKVIPVPSVKGERYTVLGGSCLVNFAKSRKNKRIANEFIYWLVNKENTIKMHEKVGYVPVRRSALKSLELRAFDRKNPNFKVPIESLDFARPLPNHSEYFKINEQLREMLQRIFLNASDPVFELERTEKEINMMLQE
jgi:ABC-type glycerol-3-phosphate transport system substrate-binding protein